MDEVTECTWNNFIKRKFYLEIPSSWLSNLRVFEKIGKEQDHSNSFNPRYIH